MQIILCDRCKKEIPRGGARFRLEISREVADEYREVIKLLPEVGVFTLGSSPAGVAYAGDGDGAI